MLDVICRLGGPYGEKTVTEGLKMLPEAEAPRAALLSPRSQFFTIRTGPKPANNMFFFFSCSKLVLQITNEFLYETLSY